MWTLWIVSFVFATNDMVELKYTRYAEFEHKETCYHAWHEVTSKFTEGEEAFCEGPDNG